MSEGVLHHAALVIALLLMACDAEPDAVRTLCGQSVPLEVDASPGCALLSQQSASHPTDKQIPSGLELCAGGEVNRLAAAGCALCTEVQLCKNGTGGCSSCADGETCVEGSGGDCVCERLCSSDADCASNGAGGRCGLGHDGCGRVRGFYCRSSSDSCVSDAQCLEDEQLPLCFFDTSDDLFVCIGRADC